MWFMAYKMRQVIGPEPRRWLGSWATCNCTTDKHPVQQIKEWQQSPAGLEYQYLLLFYEKLPEDVAKAVGEIDCGYDD